MNSWEVPYGDLYGIAIDAKGHPWLGQFGKKRLARLDPHANEFIHVTDKLDRHCPKGMAGSVDGFVYSGLGCRSDHYVAKIDIDNLTVTLFDT